MESQFLVLASELKQHYPTARIETDFFDVGGAMLSFIWREKMWNLEFQPKWGFGVSKVEEDHSFMVHQDHIFPDFESARQKLLELVTIYESEPLLTA